MWSLSCGTLLGVTTTNWLPTEIQGAIEPLDGQRLEVNPVVNVSESFICAVHANQPSSLGRSRFPIVLDSQSICLLLLPRMWLIKTSDAFKGNLVL